MHLTACRQCRYDGKFMSVGWNNVSTDHFEFYMAKTCESYADPLHVNLNKVDSN
jgi:hypothetical protein